MPKPRLLAFLDTMCSWCYGFAPQMDVVRAHFGDRVDHLTFSGGLRPFNTEPMEESFRLKLTGIYAQIGDLTGQPFGAPPSITPGFVYDTEPASRAVVTMRHLAPGEDYPYMKAIQRAYYADGEDIRQEEVLARHAEAFDIVADEFLAHFNGETMKQATLADFEVARRFGIDGFPALILHRMDGKNPNAMMMVGKGYTPAEDLIERIEAALAAEV